MNNRTSHTVLLHDIAECIRSLLNCDAACLVLRCFDRELCHPYWRDMLLAPPTSLEEIPHYGLITDKSLLTSEHVWAACDIALQTGALYTLGAHALATYPAAASSAQALSSVQSTATTAFMLIAPLECTAGSLGVVLCTSRGGNIPDMQAYRFLQQLLPHLAHLVESALRIAEDTMVTRDTSACDPPILPDAKEVATLQSLPQEHTRLRPPERTYEDVALFANLNTDELLSVVSHDLRTPLSVIKGYVCLLQTYGYAGDAVGERSTSDPMSVNSRQHYFRAVMEQIDHLEVLIGDLLDISRIRSGRIKLNMHTVALGQICQQVVQHLQDRMTQQEPGRYAIQCIIDPALPAALADAHRVQQVVTNLVENAIKYSPEGGLIEIFVYTQYALYHSHALSQLSGLRKRLPTNGERVTPANVYVTVRDHGMGIAPAQQKILFQPFTRLPQAAAKRISGHGLGLYISQRLIEAMHGRILLKSRVGQGTSITFSLPTVPYMPDYPADQNPADALSSASYQTLPLPEHC